MSDKPKVLILIVNWNNYPDTKACLESLTKISYENFQVLLVDNGSKDNSHLQFKREYPKIELISLEENLGFAGGNNVGLDFASSKHYPYILLLNNDTFIEDGNFLSTLVQELEEDGTVGAIAPAIKQTDGLIQLSILPYPTLGNTLINSLGLYHPDHAKRQYVDSVAGCCVLVRKEAVDQSGLLDENYFMYGEETEWFFRFRMKGWKILYAPIESVIHKGGSSSKMIANSEIYIERRVNVIYTLVKGKQELQAMITAVFMVLLLEVRIFYSAITGWRKGYSYRGSMIKHFLTDIRKKWKLAKNFHLIQ